MRKKRDVFEFVRVRPVLSITLGVTIIVVGILISDIPKMIVSPGWPTTNGTVVSRRLMAQRFKEYDGDFYMNIDGFIRYEYRVNGIPYSSLSVNAIDTPYYPYKIAMQYPVGKDVLVYYNPKDPSDAVLEPGYVDIFAAFDVFSYLIFGAGFYLIFLGISRTKVMRKRKQG